MPNITVSIYKTIQILLEVIEMKYFFAPEGGENHVSSRIFFENIYFFESIKSTHYCRIVHKDGENKIHSDITPLLQYLSPNFIRCRSSTIVNLSQIIKIDKDNRLLLFENGTYCDYAREYYSLLKKLMSIDCINIPYDKEVSEIKSLDS